MSSVEQLRNVVNRLKEINEPDVFQSDESRVAYLLRKLYGMEVSLAVVKELAIYEVNPEHEPLGEQDKQYYYSRLVPTNTKTPSFKRTTPDGNWKKQGSTAAIFVDGVKLASKSRLYWKKRNGTGLRLVMHEYKLSSQILCDLLNDSPDLLDKVKGFALCCISRRVGTNHANPAKVNSSQIRGADKRKRLPLGYNFCPTNEEFLEILQKKLIDPTFTMSEVVDGDVHFDDPVNIFPDAAQKRGFFFSHIPPRPDCSHINRYTPSGEWVRVNVVEIMKDDGIFGFRRTFEWHNGGFVTNWIMKEYQLHSSVMFDLPKKFRNKERSYEITLLVICKVELVEGAPTQHRG